DQDAGGRDVDERHPDRLRQRRQGLTRPPPATLLRGTELLRGVISDQNGAHLAASLEAHGFSVQRTLVVGDSLPDIEGGLRELLAGGDSAVSSSAPGAT